MRLSLGMLASLGPLGLLASLGLAACAPAVSPAPVGFEEDLGKPTTDVGKPAPAAPPVATTRPEAPIGAGLRTGTIARDRLIAVLDAGPGAFLGKIEVTPRMASTAANTDRFVGWQLVQVLDRTGPLIDLDLAPGDVLLAINDQPLSHPDQLQAVWDSLRTSNVVVAKLWRGNAKFELKFTVVPPVATR